LNFNSHGQAHLFRAVQEGIAFSFRYGLDIMKETGIDPVVIRAGEANMFLSPVFRETLAGITETEIHLYHTDGSAGAARGAGIGCGFYKSEKEAFSSLKPSGRVVPDISAASVYREAYKAWKEFLDSTI
jgi:xylulokinase